MAPVDPRKTARSTMLAMCIAVALAAMFVAILMIWDIIHDGDFQKQLISTCIATTIGGSIVVGGISLSIYFDP